MKQIPRYDPSHINPLAIKTNLAVLFNNTLTKLWMDSAVKDKIYIGEHNIECTGAIKEAWYRETKTGRYDGVHLYGPSGQKAYTQSVLNILRAANITSEEYNFHTSCAQSKYQVVQRSANRGGRYNVQNNKHSKMPKKLQPFPTPTYNRFSILYGRQGNW